MTRRGDQEAVQAWVRTVLEPPSHPPFHPTPSALASGAPVSVATDAAGAEAFQEAWAGLELPPAAVAPAAFSHRVARAWSREREAAAPLFGAPWMRAAAAAALLAGVVVGSALSGAGDPAGFSDSAEPDALAVDSTELEAWDAASLSEEYLAALGAAETPLVEETGADSSTP